VSAGVFLSAMQTVVNHLEIDPDFEKQRDEALEVYRDKVVMHHNKLLFEGEITQKFDNKGALIETKHTFPIRLIELELKRVEPAYRDKQTIDFGAGGGGELVAPPELTPAQWIEQQEKNNTEKKPPVTIEGDYKEET